MLQNIRAQQKSFFESGMTRPLAERKVQLKRLLRLLEGHEVDILTALKKDLGRPVLEGSLAEVHVLLSEIRHTLRAVHRWAKPRRVTAPLGAQPGMGWVYPQPLGQVLILSPWNYPIQLALMPWVAALASGNTAVIKPSELAPHSSQLIHDLITDNFDPGWVAVVLGDQEVASELVRQPWDHIFFTGSSAVGKKILAAAAEHLTPVTLELGGKSPAFVDATANLEVAARRIVWGKFINAGQTCVAPDHIWVEEPIKPKFVELVKKTLHEFYGPDAKASPDYGRIINHRHFDRLHALLNQGRILWGGESDRKSLYFAPTLMDNIHEDSALAREEIFGPILPIEEVRDLKAKILACAQGPRPLAAYLFSKDPELERLAVERMPFGGGCLNDTIVHLLSHKMPFGGVGASGMGRYHGQFGFDTFSHFKSWMRRPTAFDVPLRYPPHSLKKLTWLQRLLKWA